MSSAIRVETDYRPAPRVWGLWISVGLLLLVVASFWPAFDAKFVSWDDTDNFIRNVHWRGVDWERIRWMFTTFHLGHYQPLTWLTFGIQFVLLGGDPEVCHAINVLVHGANAVVFFFLTRRVLGLCLPGERSERGVRLGESQYSKLLTLSAGAGAAFFAIHPLRVESVAWITERRDVLSAMFLLLAATTYLRAAAPGQIRLASARWYWCTVLLMLLSCLCKAWGMTFFVVLLALDMYPLRRVENIRGWFTGAGVRVLGEKTPLVLIGVATAVVASMAQKSALATKTLEEWPVVSRLVQSCYGLWFYVKQSVWPSGHSPLYQLPLEVDPAEGGYLVAYAFVGLLVFAAVACARRHPGVTTSIFIYALLISPVLGLLQSGEQFVADRYSYLATMPLAIMAGAGTVMLVRRAMSGKGRAEEGGNAVPRMVATLWAGVLIAFGVASYGQTTVWYDGDTLWRYGMEVTPTSVVVRYHAAQVEKNDPAKAMELFKEAGTINPKDGVAWYSYGNLARDAGDQKEAEQAYLKAVKGMHQAYVAHQNLGILYWEQGRREEAVRQFDLGIADVTRPDQAKPSGGPYMTKALALIEAGKREEAAATLRQALRFGDVRESAEKMLGELGER